MSRSEVMPGSTVGTYTVQAKLGTTAWCETFVARGPDGQLVALKVVDGVGEAAWQSIEHTKERVETVPGHLVMPLVDTGSDPETGVRFLATPLSDHPSLTDLVDICALSPAEAVSLVKNLAIAVDGAHAAGLPHLALKPSNVFVGPPPTHAARIADFGSDLLRRTRKERGALLWLAPEQVDSEEAATQSADVFAVALLAFFAMTAKSYWAASPDDEDALLREIRSERTPPSERARGLGADLPAALDAVLLRALGPAEGRHPSARELAEALERTLAEPAATSERSSERHLVATQRLERFRLPAERAATTAEPPLQTRTLKMPRVQMPPHVAMPAPPPPRRWRLATIRVRVPRWLVLATGIVIAILIVAVVIGVVRRLRT